VFCVNCVLQLLQPNGMANLKEKRIGTKFCFNLERLASETYEMLKRTFHDDNLSRTPL